jgi:hypothetical protein
MSQNVAIVYNLKFIVKDFEKIHKSTITYSVNILRQFYLRQIPCNISKTNKYILKYFLNRLATPPPPLRLRARLRHLATFKFVFGVRTTCSFEFSVRPMLVIVLANCSTCQLTKNGNGISSLT